MDLLISILTEFWKTLCDMSPYLIFGFLTAGMLSVFISPEIIEKHLGGQGLWPILKASFFGVPLPLCSCGVIPVAASLRKHGSSKGATTAFLLSTPQTGVDSIMVTFSLLGTVFAIFRPLAAFITGVIGGTIIEVVEDDKKTETDKKLCVDECCNPQHGNNKFIKALYYGLIILPKDIGKPLFFGLIIAGTISVFVPENFFSATLGTGIIAMCAMMLVGIPVYVCATASIPVAVAMMAKGISPGAALVFLMTGPATNMAAIATIWKVMGKRTALIYLCIVAVAALISGFVLDYFFSVSGIPPHGNIALKMLSPEVKTISAISLLLIIGISMFMPLHKHKEKKDNPVENEKTISITIEGMTCSHCAQTIQRSLKECIGITSAEVIIETGKAYISGNNINMQIVIKSIEDLGYKVISF